MALGAAAALVGVAGGYVWLVTHILGAIQARDVAWSEERTEATVREREQAFVQAYERALPQRRELAEYLVATEDPTPLLTSIEALGQDAGVSLIVGSLVRDETSTDDRTMLRVVLSVRGTYDRVFRLVRLLETMPYAAILDRVALSVSKEDELWEGQVHLRVVAEPAALTH